MKIIEVSRGGGSHTVAGFAADKTRNNELIEHEQKVKEIQEETNDSEIECVGVRFFSWRSLSNLTVVKRLVKFLHVWHPLHP